MTRRLLVPALVCALALTFARVSAGADITTNSVKMPNAPDWVTGARVDRVVDRIQHLMDWDIRRVSVTFYPDEGAFEKMHGLGPTVLAISRKNENTVHIGPRVTESTFDAVFGHEMVHIISYQKYHDAIPKWLEEGLANYLAKQGAVDYDWLAKQPFPADVRDLTHPFGGTVDKVRYDYLSSQALAEMIASKCDIEDLLQLATGKKLETYLGTTCEIQDLNAAYRAWIAKKTKK